MTVFWRPSKQKKKSERNENKSEKKNRKINKTENLFHRVAECEKIEISYPSQINTFTNIMLCRAEGNMLQGPSHNSIKINGIKACYHIIFIGETESLFFMVYKEVYT